MINKNSSFQKVKNYFNTKKANKIFTRAEYMSAFQKSKIKTSYLDLLRCYLARAGYLNEEEPGVYRKLKKIPSAISYTQLYVQAYPKKNACNFKPEDFSGR